MDSFCIISSYFLSVENLLGGAQDAVVSYLLSLIASNFIVKEVKDIK